MCHLLQPHGRRETDPVSWTAIATWRQSPLKTSCELKACGVVCLPARTSPNEKHGLHLARAREGAHQNGRRCPRWTAARRSNLQGQHHRSRTPGWSRDRLPRGRCCGKARKTLETLLQRHLRPRHTPNAHARIPTGACSIAFTEPQDVNRSGTIRVLGVTLGSRTRR